MQCQEEGSMNLKRLIGIAGSEVQGDKGLEGNEQSIKGMRHSIKRQKNWNWSVFKLNTRGREGKGLENKFNK